jgi:hypothetical protein
MGKTMKLLCFLIVLMTTVRLAGQAPSVDPRWSQGFWSARWIAAPGASGIDFGVFHFRKPFHLDSVPASFLILVSADNRYRLFVNGVSVATGPARSDLANWNFDPIDLAPYLRPGDNVIAATVWNFAESRPYSQISYQTAFLLQGNSPAEEFLNSNSSWKVESDTAYSSLPVDRAHLHIYLVTAEGERVDGRKYSWNFADPALNDSLWPAAAELWYPAKARGFGTDGNWMLVQRSIPFLQELDQRFGAIRRCEPVRAAVRLAGFLAGDSVLDIPAHAKVSLLFDQLNLTNAYPELTVSGGRNAVLRLSYAEALVDARGNKGNRDSLDGKKLLGITDEYVSDGGERRHYEPLFFRTFRFLQLDIQTGDQPLRIMDLRSRFTGYPFQAAAHFESDRPGLSKIWETGWRTARLCAMDTYFDCPYYEQLQYVGDTRIQCLISLLVSGDDRLMKKAIDDLSHSVIPDGLTQSRYPSRDMQIIPTFSLWWVCMIYDFWMRRTDDAFIASKLDLMEHVIAWYQNRLADNGMLGSLSWWQFVDWSWPRVDSIEVGGVPPGVSSGGSSIVTLQLSYALQRAARVMSAFGRSQTADKYWLLSQNLATATYRLCWDTGRRMLADTYRKQTFSQHANVLGILTDAIPAGEQGDLLQRIIDDKKLTPCTYYFSFYLFEALKKVRKGDLFLAMLQPWFAMLTRGLTTFAENPEPTRSDCHAWSASPIFELLTLVAGVDAEAPGFQRVRIEPFLGGLHHLDAEIPHPAGAIRVHYEAAAGHLRARVELPPGITGTFTWNGKSTILHSGEQSVDW